MKSFRVKNVKSFLDSGEIEIRPITILIGKNSSGKSSIIRFPLVLKQSIKDNFAGPLMLNGSYVDYGNYADVVYNHDESLGMTFELVWENNSTIANRADSQGIQFAPPLRVTVEVGMVTQISLKQIKVKSFQIQDSGTLDMRISLKDGKYDWNGDDNYDPDFDSIFPSVWPFNDDRSLFISESGNYLKNSYKQIISNIEYVGPFRTLPLRDYRLNEGKFIGVGKDGSAAPHILAQKKLLGDEKYFENVNRWFKDNLGIELTLNVHEANRFDIFVTDQRTGRKNNLTDVGFGISQLLPVVVQTYLEPVSSLQKIHIIEQPEIHLHPEAQASVADLFIHGCQLNPLNRFLVETHSRYLVLRLRRRVVEGQLNPEDVVIYYVKAGENPGDPSTIEKLEIDKFGDIANWPDYFFDQAYEEVIAMKAARNKLKPQKKEDEPEW